MTGIDKLIADLERRKRGSPPLWGPHPFGAETVICGEQGRTRVQAKLWRPG